MNEYYTLRLTDLAQEVTEKLNVAILYLTSI